MPPFGGLRGNVHGSFMASCKARGRLPISVNWIFFASSHGWGAMSGYLSKLCYLEGGGSLWAQISGGTNDQRLLASKKTKVRGLSRGVVCVILRLAVLVQYRRVTQTDRQTDTRWWLLPAHRQGRPGKNVSLATLAHLRSQSVLTSPFVESCIRLCHSPISTSHWVVQCPSLWVSEHSQLIRIPGNYLTVRQWRHASAAPCRTGAANWEPVKRVPRTAHRRNCNGWVQRVTVTQRRSR